MRQGAPRDLDSVVQCLNQLENVVFVSRAVTNFENQGSILSTVDVGQTWTNENEVGSLTRSRTDAELVPWMPPHSQ